MAGDDYYDPRTWNQIRYLQGHQDGSKSKKDKAMEGNVFYEYGHKDATDESNRKYFVYGEVK